VQQDPPGAAALSEAGSRPWWLPWMPSVFVLIWSTGFVVARFGMPHAPPMTFLTWRFALSVAAFLLWIRLSGARWPQGRSQWMHLAVVGVLLHGGYLGGVWAAVKGGMSAGTAALIVGLQPLLTALWMSGWGHAQRASSRQWAGLALGLAGLVLVVWRKLGLGEASAATVALAVLALLSITAGTLWQKHHVRPCDVRTANTVQLMAAFLLCLPFALFESESFHWNAQSSAALAWSVLALTLGGSSLLVMLIQRGAATQVTSLMYLVPPCTAVLAWILFDEALTPVVLAGMVLTAAGVWLVVRDTSAARPVPPRAVSQ
jgi:drug/metabolite transporter (DMT)-like permease